MKASVGAAASILMGGLLLAQAPPPSTQSSPPPRPQGGGYGAAVFAELESIAFDEGTHRRHVRTQGKLDVLEPNQYYLLHSGAARVLVIPGYGIGQDQLLALLGGEIEARGIVRRIRPKEYPGGTDIDLVEDRDLPVLPAPRTEWPKVSLTLLSAAAVEAGSTRAKDAAGRSTAREILSTTPGPDAKDVRLAGLFRGRNLFADLPAASQRTPLDWVVKDGDAAFWVTGKEPKGKGWSLDPNYRPDTTRWVEVVGKPEVVNGVLYVKAGRVSLVKRPAADADDDSK